ncbi:FixH family protein [Bacillus marasmi]|uniref:FixH family protein n=1 Tax=Bacillus marasmi TaxID=1926279 RepID=UPI0011C87F5B|nr:FixH family protein [Bacillus marasmi]
MVKKCAYLAFFLILVMSLAACSSSENSDDELKWVEVDVTINPEKPQPNEPVTFKAEVTYDGEVITDVKDFSFEIWRAKDENHEKIEIKKATNGAYQIEKIFDVEGTYYVFAHVTAKDMHNMPTKEFVVGTPSEPEEGKPKSKFMKH